jgi:hypothetical protein
MLKDHCIASQPFEHWFELPAEHHLEVTSHHRLQRGDSVLITRWMEQYDASKSLVARFRTWTRQGLKPPYQSQIGWERYSLTGEMLDREIRFARRTSQAYLH